MSDHLTPSAVVVQMRAAQRAVGPVDEGVVRVLADGILVLGTTENVMSLTSARSTSPGDQSRSVTSRDVLVVRKRNSIRTKESFEDS